MANDISVAERIGRNPGARYLLTLSAAAAALALGRTLGPILGSHVPYVTVFAAIVLSALYCGLWPSAVVTVLSVLGLKYWFMPPSHTLRVANLREALDMLAFVLLAICFIAIGEARRRENAALRRAEKELEEHVRQRTAELDVANRGLRELTARLMQLQDDERRRIARELHDSIGQICAALSMNLTQVGADIERLSQTAKSIADSAALVEEMNRGVRTISYLLHPPLLDETGLPSALRWYVEGFSERSKVAVDLKIAKDLGRFTQEVETALFRTVQECLTNIHRHSGSPVAKVRLDHSAGEIRLMIEDEGHGMPPEKLDEVAAGGTPGVGIRGMRERLRQLGGDLEVNSNGHGTRVEARLPVITASTMAGVIVPTERGARGMNVDVERLPGAR